MDSKRVFISGPMSGLPNDNKEAFDQAAIQLKAAGFSVFNPAWMNFDKGWDNKSIAAIDMAALSHCDYIYQLEGWENSHGATAEWQVAQWMGIEFVNKSWLDWYVNEMWKRNNRDLLMEKARAFREAGYTSYEIAEKLGLEESEVRPWIGVPGRNSGRYPWGLSKYASEDNKKTPLEMAKYYISKFYNKEYGSDSDEAKFENLSHVDLAYTTVDNRNEEFDVHTFTNLNEFTIITTIDEFVANVDSYESLEDMIENALMWLDFDNLVRIQDNWWEDFYFNRSLNIETKEEPDFMTKCLNKPNPIKEPEKRCNTCEYYEGIYGYEGHAPCSYHKLGGVLWNACCDNYILKGAEEDEKEKEVNEDKMQEAGQACGEVQDEEG